MRILKHKKADRARALRHKRHEENRQRVKMHVTKGDLVRVVRGDDKGKEGRILRVFPKTGRVTIDGVNIVKRHRRARRAGGENGIIEMPAPVHASDGMLLDPQKGVPTRTRRRIDEDGTKERISVESGQAIPRSR